LTQVTLLSITVAQAVSHVKGLQGVDCQYVVGECDIHCFTPRNARTPNPKSKFVKIIFEKFKNSKL